MTTIASSRSNPMPCGIVIGSASTERNGQRVSRLGSPLVNEVVIPLKDKDKWNSSDPEDDGAVPELRHESRAGRPAHRAVRHQGAPAPRNDLVAVFLTGRHRA